MNSLYSYMNRLYSLHERRHKSVYVTFSTGPTRLPIFLWGGLQEVSGKSLVCLYVGPRPLKTLKTSKALKTLGIRTLNMLNGTTILTKLLPRPPVNWDLYAEICGVPLSNAKRWHI